MSDDRIAAYEADQKAREQNAKDAEALMSMPPTPTQRENDLATLGVYPPDPKPSAPAPAAPAAATSDTTASATTTSTRRTS